MSESVVTELDDRWILPYRGMSVMQVRVSYQLILLLEDGSSISVEQPANLTQGSITAPGMKIVEVVPERQDVAAALALFGKTVLSAVAFKSGQLRVVFDDGKHLNVRPTPTFEAWSVRSPGNLCIVCQPGGGLAVWT